MIALKLTKIGSSKLMDTPHQTGQLIYCVDSGKAYFDISSGKRYSDIEDNLVIGDTKSDFDNDSNKYFNKVYIDLSKNTFYKYNFDDLQFNLIYTDDEFLDIISSGVALEPATLDDLETGKKVAPVTLSSNVYYSKDGTTTLDQMLNVDLFITNTKAKYVDAVTEGQRVFKIPFPVAKYSLYRDHMSICYLNRTSNKVEYLTADKFKINNGYLVINENQPGIPLGDRLLFIFYYTRTTKLNQTQIVTTDDIVDGAITIEKIDPFIRIPISLIEQSEDAQTVTQEEKDLINSFKNFEIKSLSADVIEETEQRKFVDSEMYDLLVAILEGGGGDGEDGQTPILPTYVHPATHPASMIILRDLNKDLEQYSREIEDRWKNTEVLFSGISETRLNEILEPGNYTIKLSSVNDLPIPGKCRLKVDTSNGLPFEGLEEEWITQKLVYNLDNDKIRIFYRSCSNGKNEFSKWIEVLTTDTGLSTLETEAKDIIGAINEVFQCANNGRTLWQSVIGYPLDNYDKFPNLYEKTLNIKQNLVDKLIDRGVECTINNTLQELINYSTDIGDLQQPKTGTVTSSTGTKPFTDGSSNFDSNYIEIINLFINTDVVNIYKNGNLYASFKKDGNGIYSIGNLNKKFIESEEGAYIGDGFRIPVESSNTEYTYYAVPI